MLGVLFNVSCKVLLFLSDNLNFVCCSVVIMILVYFIKCLFVEVNLMLLWLWVNNWVLKWFLSCLMCVFIVVCVKYRFLVVWLKWWILVSLRKVWKIFMFI